MKAYLVIYEWTGKNYSAYVPDLPGCVTAGDSLEEAEELMKGAMTLYIQALGEAGRAVPEPTTKAKPLAVLP